VFAAHLDEIGLVVTHLEDDGTLRVQRSGMLSPHKIGERPVEIMGDVKSITGVLSFGSGHTKAPGEGIAWDDVRVITGLSKEGLKKAGVRLGSTGVPVAEGRGPIVFGDSSNPSLAAWTLDNRAGVALQLQLLETLKAVSLKPPFPTIMAFTVHEEGGCHGAKVLAHREKPEIFIAIDGCPWKPGSGLEVDGRPAAWSKDELAHYDQRLLNTFCLAAKNAGTELQTAVLSSACSDASAVYSSGAAGRVGIIGHPRFNSHGFEVTNLSTFSNLLNTLVSLIKLDQW
jgi:putative aminopeptidase FrvX